MSVRNIWVSIVVSLMVLMRSSTATILELHDSLSSLLRSSLFG